MGGPPEARLTCGMSEIEPTALVVVGHHRSDSLTAAVAERVAKRLAAGGYRVDLLHLEEEAFDPRSGVADEPDYGNRDKRYSEEVHRHIARVHAADVIVPVFPVWWYGLPALLKGWIGMAGLIFILHFGFFHLAALAWQRAGVQAAPIMHAPVLARSLRDFWSHRWNLGFKNLAHDLLFQPLAPRVGASAAGFAVFLASGLVHDLVISVPAGGGYGLPTGYFALQGLGVLIERSPAGRGFGLGRGLGGRIYMALFAAGPGVALFHPTFVREVMLPFMAAIGIS